MKQINYLSIKLALFSRFVLMLTTFGLVLSLSACSSDVNKNAINTNNSNTIQTLNKQQKVELGTVVAVRTIQIQPDANRPYGSPFNNVGISASSGGFSGIYGSIDLATLGHLFERTNEVKTVQEVIVKKENGETVAITQAFKERFKQGDAVRILVRNGNAQVIH